MTVTTATPVDLTEHVIRSVRGWLHVLVPAVPIYVERQEASDTDAPSRAAFRLEVAAGPAWVEASAGGAFLTMSLIVHYAAPKSETIMWDTMRVVGKIRAASVRPQGRIPMRVYNLEWPQPPEITKPSSTGGSLPEALDIAVAGLDGSTNGGSAPSAPLSVSVPAGAKVGVRPRNWPSGAPLVATWEVYAAATGDPLTLQGTVADGDTLELASLSSGASAPTNRNLVFKGLRVDSIDVATAEPDGSERIMDAAITLRLRVLTPITTPAQIDDGLT